MRQDRNFICTDRDRQLKKGDDDDQVDTDTDKKRKDIRGKRLLRRKQK